MASFVEKNPRCGACNQLFRCRRRKKPQSEAALQIFSYLRCCNKLDCKILSLGDRFCSKCYLKANKKIPERMDKTVISQSSSSDEETKVQPTSLIDFSTMSDYNIKILTGLTRFQLDDLLKSCLSLRNRKTSVVNRLGMLLVKMRHDLSTDLLSVLFGYQDKSSVSKALQTVREALMTEFVSLNLGVQNISREQVLKRVPVFTQELYCAEKNNLVVVIDGTYLYTQKTNNYQIQRRFFSVHKGRPLIKPMLIVTTDGYIVDCIGPYVGTNNDASITLHMFNDRRTHLRNFFISGDIFLVDRGFRDAIQLLLDLDFIPKMPSFLSKGEKQLTTQESNESRLITKLRWVVEAKNGHLKTKYKMFGNTIPIALLDTLDDYLRIACALENKYAKPLVTDSDKNSTEVQRMLDLVNKPNQLLLYLEKNMLINKRCKKVWIGCTSDELLDFPQLTADDVHQLTLGVYQIKNARSYTAEHLKEDGLYKLSYCIEDRNVYKFKIESRHASSKQYELFVQTNPGENGYKSIAGWYCKCRSGARVVGCCSHIASVIWYLSYGRYHAFYPPAEYLNDLFKDSRDVTYDY